MTKIMLVEDDKSLREIYGVRLLAEGYDIVSAGDGEEALAMAIKERPQLIVSDVMMPKISGFDMLDILRSTTETKNIKVIMMTALSSEEQRQRGESLGADRYLVKSQVGIEDVVRVVHEVLEDRVAAPDTSPPRPAAAPARPAPSAPSVPDRPPAAAPAPQPAAPPVATPTPPAAPTPAPASVVPSAAPSATPKPASIKTRVIQPLNDPAAQPVDINELLDKELAKEAGVPMDDRPSVQTTEQERDQLEKDLADFEAAQAGVKGQTEASDELPPPPPPPPAQPQAPAPPTQTT